MPQSDNVVPLFVTDAALESAWQDFDAAMKHTHALYADGDASEVDRREAALDAARKETAFRDLFARFDRQQPRTAAAS